MFCDAINKNQINIFSGSGNLYFYVRKVSFMIFAFIEKGHLNFAFSTVTELRYSHPSVVEQRLAVCFDSDDIILL